MKYDNNNLFAKIIRKEMASTIVYEDQQVLAINDIHPVAPVHILAMPKGQYISFDDFASNAKPDEAAYFFATIRKIAYSQGLDKTGYRLVMNHGSDAAQTVMHFHVHILGKRPLGAIVAGDTYHNIHPTYKAQ